MSRNTIRSVAASAMAVTVLASLPCVASSQTQSGVVGVRGGVQAGSMLDDYLRYLQTLGRVPLNAWGVRPFSSTEADALGAVSGAHPWRSSWLFRAEGAGHLVLLPLEASARFNTGFPWGSNDGAIWAGRGLTTALQGGVAGKWGPLSLALDPIVFRAENTSFRLQPNGQTRNGRFADGEFPLEVDRPQRFGDGAYSRFDWGESTLRIDALGMSAGISTADQYWGPATTFPVILGNNAPGIPRVFIGTEYPTNIAIGRVQLRLEYGIENQSDFSPVTGSTTFIDASQPGTRRFMSGLIGTFSPGAIPGLEVGAARFFHQAWSGHVSSAELRTPFEGLLKSSLAAGPQTGGSSNADALKNQLASVFARWVLPHSGFELYTEFGHEDHNYDLRDLEEEPDHSRIAMVGFRKAFARTDSTIWALRGEYIDGTVTTLGRHRWEGGNYTHTVLTQGHTQDGQLLGADIGVGSPAGAIIAWDTFSPRGRTSWYVQRTVDNNQPATFTTQLPGPELMPLSATIGMTGYRFGRAADLWYGAAFTDARRGPALPRQPNLNVTIGFVAHLH